MRTTLLLLYGAILASLVTSAPVEVHDATFDVKSAELLTNDTIILENVTADEIINAVIEEKTSIEKSDDPVKLATDEKVPEIVENIKLLLEKLGDFESKNINDEKVSENATLLLEILDDSETKNVSDDEKVSENNTLLLVKLDDLETKNVSDEDLKPLIESDVVENNDSCVISDTDDTSNSDENESIDIDPIIDLVVNSNDTESLQNFTQILNENPKILDTLTSTIAQGDPNLLVSYIFLGKNGLENLFEFLQLHLDILLKIKIDNNDEFEDVAEVLDLEVLNILKALLIDIESNDTFSENLNKLREYLVNDTEAMNEFISINNDTNYDVDLYVTDDESDESYYDESDELIVNVPDESIDEEMNESNVETEIKNSKENETEIKNSKENETEIKNSKENKTKFEPENQSKLVEKSDSIEVQLEPTPTNLLDETEINVTQSPVEIIPESKV